MSWIRNKLGLFLYSAFTVKLLHQSWWNSLMLEEGHRLLFNAITDILGKVYICNINLIKTKNEIPKINIFSVNFAQYANFEWNTTYTNTALASVSYRQSESLKHRCHYVLCLKWNIIEMLCFVQMDFTCFRVTSFVCNHNMCGNIFRIIFFSFALC